ncbi:hypothetical protein P0100_23555, partial [Yersinia pestis]|nr:hypothetical protein [Yersinia pestis]
KSAGVFVNWWQSIRYDLKTIIATGWHHSLIPDVYLIGAFFQSEADEIEALDSKIGEVEGGLNEAIEIAQEMVAFEPEEDEKVTATVVKKALRDLINDLKNSSGESAKKELKNLQEQERAITAYEKQIRESKAEQKLKSDELELKLQLKRLGGDEFKSESQELIRQVDAQLENLNSNLKDDKKKINALSKDRTTLIARINVTDEILTGIGGQLTEEEARQLILKKIYDLAIHELNHYLNAANRELIQVIENLWNKYAVSYRELETERDGNLRILEGFLGELGYI